MKRTVLFLLLIVSLVVSIPGMAARQPNIGCAIYKFDDTFMTGVRNAILDAAKGKARVEMVDSQNSQPTRMTVLTFSLRKSKRFGHQSGGPRGSRCYY